MILKDMTCEDVGARIGASFGAGIGILAAFQQAGMVITGLGTVIALAPAIFFGISIVGFVSLLALMLTQKMNLSTMIAIGVLSPQAAWVGREMTEKLVPYNANFFMTVGLKLLVGALFGGVIGGITGNLVRRVVNWRRPHSAPTA